MFKDLIIKPGIQEKFTSEKHKIKICEDYGLVFNDGIIISDGCSSAENTDIGARALCYSQLYLLGIINGVGKYPKDFENYITSDFFIYYVDLILLKAKKIINSFPINNTSLHATLSTLCLFKNKINIHMINDGFVVVKYKYGDVLVYRTYYSLNAPYYLICRDEKYKENYHRVFKNNKYIIECTILDKNNNTKNKNTTEHHFSENLFLHFNVDEIEYVLIASDGLESFKKKGNKDYIEPLEIIKNLIDFKSMTGEFLQRRCKNMFRDFEKENIYHLDDIVIGGIYLGD